MKLHQLGKEDRHKALLKLHRQFAHPPQKKLIALIKDSGSWHEDFQTDMNEIYQNCELCKVYAKTPPRPVVSLPWQVDLMKRLPWILKVGEPVGFFT